MTTLRTAAQQALEFLDAEFGLSPGEAPRIDALRAALAEETLQRLTDVQQEIEASLAEPTQEPQRKPPATIDEMFNCMNKAPRGVFFGHDWMEAWRAAEQHHGIKENT